MEEPVSAPPSEPEPEPTVAPSEPEAEPETLPRESSDASVEPTAQADAGPAEPVTQPDPLPREPSVAPAELPAQPDSVPVEPEAQTNSVPPAPPVERPRKKRKLEEVGFESSTYSKIRTIVRNLRPLFVQVFQNANFRETVLVGDILKEIKRISEMSKQLRTDLAALTEPQKPSTIPPVKDDPNDAIEGDGGTIPQTNEAENVMNNLKGSEEEGAELNDVPKNLEDGFKGSYVVGGSPIGWNFLVYPGSKPMYYGRSKAEKQACQIEN